MTEFSVKSAVKLGAILQGLGALVVLIPRLSLAAAYEPATAIPPKPEREFRGAWVATVNNIDWPSKPGLSATGQKAELVAILNRAAALKLNAIILQVRPACDAMYASPIEPWSEYLTGVMGKPPEPFYDPLTFAVEAAHKRGLELHAWFNPYRALHPSSKSPIATNHISKTRPDLVRKYGEHLWLDPGDPDVQTRSLRVVMDVVKRYDIDGVHFDDYFYPYPERGSDGKYMDFPDAATWEKLGTSTKLSRDDWRRENVNTFIQRVHNEIHATKPWVKFGISPFGIWRPGYPRQIRGKDAYSELYADSRKWLANGWLDYCAPQLYWSIDAKETSFPVLLAWWAGENAKSRHLWPGIKSALVGSTWKPDEIVRQIQISREQAGVTGHILYNMQSLMRSNGLNEALQRGIYSRPALVPATPWLDAEPPAKPRLTGAENSERSQNPSLRVRWETSGGQSAWLWVLQFRTNEVWTTEILPENQKAWTFENARPDVIAVSTVSRTGNMSAPAAVRKSPAIRRLR